MNLQASKLGYKALNQKIREMHGEVVVTDCYGERFIGSGAQGKEITIHGTPGNALGAYLDGATIRVHGNVQDAVGDTMNDGRIIIYGNAGDALGYAMRGGSIYVRGNAGYRTGIHMKQYREKCPAIVVGGSCGSFLGEYVAGGLMVILGLDTDSFPAGNFTGTGMHGGAIYIRSNKEPKNLPAQVSVRKATKEDMERIKELLSDYASYFDIELNQIYAKPFYLLTPNAKNPYKQLYVGN